MLIITYVNVVFTLLFWQTQGPLWRILRIATNQPLIAFILKLLVDRLINCEGVIISITIHDNGVGIRAENNENLFRMFYRDTTNSTGSGLGLYIAHEAADKLGGTLNFKSVMENGQHLRYE